MPSSASGSAETLPGSALGTPAYMSPEQAEGDLEHLGPRSDVYSLGATLYCLLTGKPPFEGDVADVLRGVQKGGFRPPRAVDPSIDRALEAVCLKAMALKPDDRYASPKALAEDVERWMADEPVTAWREPWTRRARRWARRNRTAVTAAGAAVLVALVGTAAVLAVQTRANADLKAANADLAVANAKVTRPTPSWRPPTSGSGHGSSWPRRRSGCSTRESARICCSNRRSSARCAPSCCAGHRSSTASWRGCWEGRRTETRGWGWGALTMRWASSRDELDSMTDALAMHERALALFEDLASKTPTDAELRREVERSCVAVALLLLAVGQNAEALAAAERACAIARDLAAADPADIRRQVELAQVERRRADVLLGNSRSCRGAGGARAGAERSRRNWSGPILRTSTSDSSLPRRATPWRCAWTNRAGRVRPWRPLTGRAT